MMPRQNKAKLILCAAEKMVQSKRFHEITLDEVAKEASIGKGTIYRYFKDKDDLFFQLVTSGIADLSQAIEDIAEKEKTKKFKAVFTRVCKKISSFIDSRHAMMRVMGEHEGRFHALKMHNKEEFKKIREKMRSAISKILQIGVDEGKVRTDIPLNTQAHMLMCMMHSPKRIDPEEHPRLEVIIDMFLNGVSKTDVL
ncbi:MAG: TetR/AcrR family transcriptional regulator [Planctomycetota bacterium]|jgi:AcrR family transcriptional regulator